MGITDRDLERHSNNLDAIRLFAALFVLIGHAPAMLYNEGYSWDPINKLFGLRIQTLGVCIFFVVSGFLVSRSWQERSSIRGFILSRVLRIFPALIIVVVLSVYVLGPCLTTLSISDYFLSSVTLKYLQNVSLYRMYYYLPGVFEGNPHPGSVNGSLWTLPYEFTCYLLLMTLGIIKALKNRLVALLIILVIIFQYIIFQSTVDAMVIPVLGIDFKNLFPLLIYFLCGMLYYQFRDMIKFGTFGWIICAIGLALIKFGILPQMMFAFFLPYFVFALAFSKKLNMRDLGKYGDFSYGFYLYAFPMQQLIAYLIPSELSPLSMIVLSTAGTLPFAVLSWRLIESPALNLRSRLSKKPVQ
ncbi:MAG: acyltransferase family protein [Bacteroidota bacterium]